PACVRARIPELGEPAENEILDVGAAPDAVRNLPGNTACHDGGRARAGEACFGDIERRLAESNHHDAAAFDLPNIRDLRRVQHHATIRLEFVAAWDCGNVRLRKNAVADDDEIEVDRILDRAGEIAHLHAPSLR